jgi:UDP-N-acetylmuramate dehydrogenase
MTPEEGKSLASLCTLGVGGAARWFCRATSENDLRDALRWADDAGRSVHILGGGSNVVFADEGFDGLVISIEIRGVTRERRDGQIVLSAGAGEAWDSFVEDAVADGLAGVECLSGIPGLVGGTPVQNVGAYGQDVSGTIRHVDVVDRSTRASYRWTNQDCGFGYRTSRFKREDAGRFVVTRVEFLLLPGGSATVLYPDVVAHFERLGDGAPSVAAVRDAILAIRRGKGMVIEPGNAANRSVGSFFVNPVIPRGHLARLIEAEGRVPSYTVDEWRVKVPAAWLIERAGFAKGWRRGPVGISPFQAQAIVNHGGATAGDIVNLAVDIKRAVLSRFAVALVPEPVFVGFPQSPELAWLLDPEPSR